MKTRSILVAAIAVIAALSAACGFECDVQGTKEQFASCDDLQKSYDTESARTNPSPDPAVLDDLDTCGAAYGCALKP